MGIGAVFDATIFKMTPLAKLLAGQAADVGRPIATIYLMLLKAI